MLVTTDYKDEAGDGFTVIASGPAPSGRTTVELRLPLLDLNDRQAALNRAHFRAQGITAFNLVSSPGSGKTALLERTLDEFAHAVKCAVLVGDLETDCDARRLRRPHAPVAQITTGSSCHLDAAMVAGGANALDLEGVRLLFVENVGNLVCPAAFDLGEAVRVVLLSAAEGEDKPLKYPPIFKSAQVVVVTKLDLVEPLGFDLATALDNIRRIAPQAKILTVSSRSGAGLSDWYAFLRTTLEAGA